MNTEEFFQSSMPIQSLLRLNIRLWGEKPSVFQGLGRLVSTARLFATVIPLPDPEAAFFGLAAFMKAAAGPSGNCPANLLFDESIQQYIFNIPS